jgi:hypothetical protein
MFRGIICQKDGKAASMQQKKTSEGKRMNPNTGLIPTYFFEI